MPIFKLCQLSGSSVSYFKAAHARVNLDKMTATVSVVGWPDEAACLSGQTSTWGTQVTVPIATLADLDDVLLHAPELAGGERLADADGTVPTARARKWVAIKARREQLDEASIAIEDFAIDADSSSRLDVMGAIMAMQLSSQGSRMWRCSDNVMRSLSLSQLIGAGTAIAARRQTLIEVSDALYQQIQAAQTLEQIEAINWPV